MTRKVAYDGRDIMFVQLQVASSNLRPAISLRNSGTVPPEYILLMQQCWAEDPLVRPSFDSLVEALQSQAVLDPPNSPASTLSNYSSDQDVLDVLEDISPSSKPASENHNITFSDGDEQCKLMEARLDSWAKHQDHTSSKKFFQCQQVRKEEKKLPARSQDGMKLAGTHVKKSSAVCKSVDYTCESSAAGLPPSPYHISLVGTNGRRFLIDAKAVVMGRQVGSGLNGISFIVQICMSTCSPLLCRFLCPGGVYLADYLGRRVVVKNVGNVGRVKFELEMICSLNHPNIRRVRCLLC
jgi:hypothetical protein